MIYWVFLRRDTLYQTNRYFLIGSLIVSFLLPLINISMPGTGPVNYAYVLEPVVIAPRVVAERMQDSHTLVPVLLIVYLLGSAYFTTRFLYQIYRLTLLVRRYGITQYNGAKLVIVEEDYVPFSIFNLVFMQRSLFNKPEMDKIIEHEKAHVSQYHTLDLILLELFVILQWYNPFVWLLRRSLKSLHEYLADQSVLSNGYNHGEYKQLLLDQTFGVRFITLSNNFNQSLTKKRFIMMSKRKTPAMSLIRMSLIIPFAMAVSITFAINYADNVLPQSPDVALNAGTNSSMTASEVLDTPQEDPVFKVVEVMPKYPGGQEALFKYMSNNVKYPENARKNRIQGTVFISFVVKKDGTVSDARVLRGVDEELDKEALRVVNEMPKWNPGKEKGKPVNVQFNLPVAFKLNGGEEKSSQQDGQIPKSYQEVKRKDK
jgi:TonB family protein